MNKLKELLQKDYVILDGGMGTMLQAAGMKMGETPEMLNITEPELLISIHEQYLKAGADIIYANTFGGNRYKLEECGHSVDELVTAGIKNAKKACANVNPRALVALDVGPIGQLLEPTGTLSFEEAYEMYAEIVKAGEAAGADLVVFETMTDLLDVKAAVLAAKENSQLPIMTTMTFEENMRTFTGCQISSFALTISGLGVDALGVNCSLGPKELEPVIKELTGWTNLPVIVKPNAGLPDPVTNEYNVTAEQFAEFMKDLRKYGIKIFGGCCGTTPEFIKCLSDMLHKEGNLAKEPVKMPSAVCSATSTVIVDQPRVVGERINPTGKKVFKQALLDNDMDYILGQALEQTSAGADILDVNVGLPGIDERQMMIDTVKSLQSVVDVPLQLDSTIPEVLDSALRIYNGKPIVNSVNGEEESLNNILPIVKKYGAAVIGLALDKNGHVLAWGTNTNSKLGLNYRSVTDNMGVPSYVVAGAMASDDPFVLNADRTNSTRNTQSTNRLSNIVSIDAGDNHAVAIADNGSVYAWGDDSEGQLGIEPNTSKRFSNYDGKAYAYAPIKVQRGDRDMVSAYDDEFMYDAVQVSAGKAHTLIRSKDYNTYATGDNSNGQLGIDSGDVTSPKYVDVDGNSIYNISAGGNSSAFIGGTDVNDNLIYTVGNNGSGQLGIDLSLIHL